jgi:hypothetical protein
LATRTPGAAAAVAAIVVLTLLAQSGSGQSALAAVGVAGAPAHYTALAFVQPLRLPVRLARTRTVVDGAFEITNREGRSEHYGWTVLASGATVRTLARGTVSLAPGRQAYLNPRLTITCDSRQATVAVRLSSGQQIDFLSRCATPARTGRRLPALRPLHGKASAER